MTIGAMTWLGSVIIKDTFFETFNQYTYSGHPVGAAVANKVLDIIEAENLVGNAAAVGGYLRQQLVNKLSKHPNVGEVRGKGLLVCIQLMADAGDKVFFKPELKIAHKVAQVCYQQGLVIRPLPRVSSLALTPLLTLTKAQVDQLVEKLLSLLIWYLWISWSLCRGAIIL